jgi:hypothetical protein
MSIEDRLKAFEQKFSHDEQLKFKVEARTSKLVGLWAAEQMGYSGVEADAYAKVVVACNLDEPGFDDVKRKVQADFAEKKLDISEHLILSVIEKKLEQATKQIEDEAKGA